MNEAEVGDLLNQSEILESRFVSDVPTRRGVPIEPVIVDHCDGETINWLVQFQVLLENGRPVQDQTQRKGRRSPRCASS